MKLIIDTSSGQPVSGTFTLHYQGAWAELPHNITQGEMDEVSLYLVNSAHKLTLIASTCEKSGCKLIIEP